MGDENAVLSGLVGCEDSHPRSTRSKMDAGRYPDCEGELASDSVAGDRVDHGREVADADDGGIETDVCERIVDVDDTDGCRPRCELAAECIMAGLPSECRFLVNRRPNFGFSFFGLMVGGW